MSKFEIKNFHNQRGREGNGFYCTLYVDGVRAAEVIDDASGAPTMWQWFNAAAKKKWDAYVATLPRIPFGFGMEGDFAATSDTAIEDIIVQYETRKKFQRAAKTKTLFRLKTDDKNQYWTINRSYSPEIAKQLKAKHGDNLLEIINETL